MNTIFLIIILWYLFGAMVIALFTRRTGAPPNSVLVGHLLLGPIIWVNACLTVLNEFTFLCIAWCATRKPK